MTIGSIVISTSKYVDQVIVVDDGSMDHTSEIAEVAGAKVIRHPENQGKGAALKTGFSEINDADVVVTLDADGQHDPCEIPKLIEPIINAEADITNGSRHLGEKDQTPRYRRVGQMILDEATNLNSRIKITDSQSGFRAFAAYTLPAFKFWSKGYSIESEMIIDASKFGSRIKEVPIEVKYHGNNQHKKNPLSHGLGVLFDVIMNTEFNRPLYYFSVPGFIFIMVGLTMSFIFFNHYLNHIITSLLPTIAASMVVLWGLFIAFIGMVLDAKSRSFDKKIAK